MVVGSEGDFGAPLTGYPRVLRAAVVWGVGSVRTVRSAGLLQTATSQSIADTHSNSVDGKRCVHRSAHGPPHACNLTNTLQVQRRQQDQWPRRHQNSLFSRLTALPTLAA